MSHADVRIKALTRAREDVLALCGRLTDAEWGISSAAPGWSVQDVIAHLGAGCHALFTPAALTILRSDLIERTNDDFVESRRGWQPSHTIREYDVWSRRVVGLARVVEATPARRIPVRLAELGRFPAGLLLTGAFVFDHYTHLRFDVSPALGAEPWPPDGPQLAVAAEWMAAVLDRQIRSGALPALDAPVVLDLRGAGGSRWTLSREGMTPGATNRAVATIAGSTCEFPEWATQRASWRDRELELVGDVDYAAAVLDQVNVV